MSEYAYLNLYTKEAMAKTLVIRDERIDRLREENDRLRMLCARMATHWLPNDIRMTSAEWRERDGEIVEALRELGIEVEDGD